MCIRDRCTATCSHSPQGVLGIDRRGTGTIGAVHTAIRRLGLRQMAYRWCGLAVILVALPLGAGTINVSAQVAALLDTGDALSFTVPASNFGINAGNYG